MLKHKGFCYTKSGKLYVLLFDSNYVVEYRVKGKCSMQGCNHQLYFTKVIENEEGHACAIGCSNTPSHFSDLIYRKITWSRWHQANE